jgi:hypothetical protein
MSAAAQTAGKQPLVSDCLSRSRLRANHKPANRLRPARMLSSSSGVRVMLLRIALGFLAVLRALNDGWSRSAPPRARDLVLLLSRSPSTSSSAGVNYIPTTTGKQRGQAVSQRTDCKHPEQRLPSP